MDPAGRCSGRAAISAAVGIRRTCAPIVLYDHLPGILAGFPAIIFLLLAIVVHFFGSDVNDHDQGVNHMCFWIGLSMMIIWYIAYGFNMPQARFWLVFGLIGTFIGIPVVLELTGIIRPFTTLGQWLGSLSPIVNASAWFVLSMVMGIIWLINFIWSRTHLRVRIDEAGLTLYRLGGRGERFELIGLKTENEPLDYLELFLAGIGSLSLKTRMNKPIFTMRRVMGLYRPPLFPFVRGKLSRIDELLSYHGKVVTVDAVEQTDLITSEEDDAGDEYDAEPGHEDADPHGREIT
jgi:hypothetical protein